MIQNAAVTHIDATEDGELITMKLDSKYVNYYFEFQEVKMDLKNEFEKNYKKIIENLKSGNDIVIKQKKEDYKIYINSIKKL